MINNDPRAILICNLNEYESPFILKCAACQEPSSERVANLHERWINRFALREKSDHKKNSPKQSVAKEKQNF